MRHQPSGNLLLDRISWANDPDIQDQLRPIPLEQSLVLYEARAPIDYTYFPTRGALSSVVVMSDGSMIEVATIGREGAVGLPSFGATGSSPNKVFVQIPGDALRIESALLQKRVEKDEPLRKLLLKYHEAFTFQISQSVACNGLHAVPERCCRWLLMSHDRVDGEEILLTHEFMSVMLGVRRPSVTEVLQGLKERGLISYTRGKITVLDRKGLEKGACECYRVVRDEYARLLD